jgi:protocatechuate 3,4-dioxygenase beta subunit
MKSRTVFALVCCLLVIQLVSARQITQQEKNSDNANGSISGRVTIQDKPVPDIELSLFPRLETDHSIENITIKTDKDGRYRFDNLPANNYRVRVLSNEYVSAIDRYSNRYSGASAGINVAVGQGVAVQNAEIAIILGGKISGRVLDSDGKPVAGIPVEVYWSDGQPAYFASKGAEESTTDSQGKFKLSGLVPGAYLIGQGIDMERMVGKVRDKNDFSHIGNVHSDSYYERTYYPGVQDKAKAKPFEITTGIEIKDIFFSIGKKLRAYSVNGQIIDEEGNPISNYRFGVCRRTPDGGYSSSTDGQTDINGYFYIKGFLSGTYFIFQGYSDNHLQFPDTDFEIKAEDLSNVYVKAGRGYSIAGSIVLEENNKSDVLAMIPKLKLRARTSLDRKNNSTIQFKEAQVNDNGTFIIAGLRPGAFDISIEGIQVGRYFEVTRIEYPNPEDNQQSQILLSKNRIDAPLSVENNSLSDVKIFVRYKNGTINCQINFINGKRPPGIPLWAWITNKGGGGPMLEISPNGNFVVDGLGDGEYSIEIGDGRTRFTEAKTIKITTNSVAVVTIDLDVRKIKKTN